MIRNIFKTTLVICALTPLAVFADGLVTDVTNSVGNTVETVGDTVGGVVKDTGKGVSKVVNGRSSKAKSHAHKTISDSTITKNVKDKIKDLTSSKQIDEGNDIQVTTNNGVVTLNGKVGKESDIATIKQAVSSEYGVKSLTVNLIVKSAQ